MNHRSNSETGYVWNAPRVVCQIVDGEAIVIHFEKGHYYSALNTGAWALEMLGLGLNVSDISLVFVDHFGISVAQARQDLSDFLNQLIAEDLVVPGSRNERVSSPTRLAPDTGPRSEPDAYTTPVLVKYTDLEDLLTLDPVHDVIAMSDEQKSDELARAFECARESGESYTYDIEMAGRNVRFHFVGRRLLDLLTPAMAHLQTNAERIDLDLFIADSESTGVYPRLDPVSFGDDLVPNAQTSSRSVRCTYVPASELYCCLHPERACGYIWARSSTTLQHWDISAPFRPLLGWWAESVGAQLAHGAVVGTEQAAILLGGESGVGKSTLTLACLGHGLLAVGDDYVWMEPGEPVRAFSLYCTVKMSHVELQNHFSEYAARTRHVEGEKTCLYLSGVSGVGLVSSLPLRAMVALRISGETLPRVRAASTMEVLGAVVPSSLRQLSGSTLSGLQRFGQILSQTRALTFEAGTDYTANVKAIVDLLTKLSRDPITMSYGARGARPREVASSWRTG